jgi:hypothetical protein
MEHRMSDLFTDFWAAYPRRTAVAVARKAWAKAIKRAKPEAIIEAIQAQVAAGCFPDKTYTPYPATWLNADRWLDEIETAAPKTLADDLAAQFRAAALAGDDAAKAAVKADARNNGVAWETVVKAMQALRASDPV